MNKNRHIDRQKTYTHRQTYKQKDRQTKNITEEQIYSQKDIKTYTQTVR